MTTEEFDRWHRSLCDWFPATRELFTRAANPAAMRAMWFEALETLPLDGAETFLKAIAAGDIDAPKFLTDWASLPAMLRRWWRVNRPLAEPTTKSWAEEKSFRCLLCRDRGFGIEIFNPRWVSRHESQIENGLSEGWEHEARAWCRANACGPLIFAVDCGECDYGRHIASRRKRPTWIYRRGALCVVPPCGPTYWPQALAEFVAAHPAIDAAQWRPRQGYDDIVGDDAK